jgi:aminopeptidase
LTLAAGQSSLDAMIDPRVRKLAQVLVHYSAEVKAGERVRIGGTPASEPLLREVYREVVRAGAHPLVRMSLTEEEHLYYSEASDAQLDYLDPFMVEEAEKTDVSIKTFPDQNPHALTSVPPEKKQRRMRAMKPYTETLVRRWQSGEYRWVGTAYPTAALAQEAHLSLEEFAEFLFEAMKLNEPDPVAAWKAVSARQQRICDRLNRCSTIRYVGLDTDLTFSCAGRPWINCDGKLNFPDGEVFTGPVEDSVNGPIRFTFPGIFQGQEVEDIFLRFKAGRVVEARAAKGEALLHQLLDTDPGARCAGEIAIGTNEQIRRFSKNMLLDEKMGGTIHLAVGLAIPGSGSKNFSALHWDMLKDMREGGEILADGEVIYRDGRFLPEWS